MRKVEVNLSIKTTPERVIKAFTDSQMLRDWWKVERMLVETKSEGVYTLAWNISDKGFEYVSSGRIEKIDPKEELVISNLVYLNPERPILGPMSLTVKATPSKQGTDVYLCQDGYQSGEHWDWYYEAVKDAWPLVMETLKEYLEANS